VTSVRVLAPYFPPAVNGGGPIRTLDALVRTAPDRMRVEVVTRDRDLCEDVRLDVPRTVTLPGGRRVHFVDTRGVDGTVRLAAAMVARPHADLTYVNSVFDPRFGVLPLLLRRCRLPLRGRFLVAPRGEFDPGALALKRAKKQRYLDVARASRVFHGVTWHASTELEAAHIRAAVGPDAEVVVRENETTLPAVSTRVQVRPSDRFEVVMAGRISPKKRTHLVIEALAQVSHPVRLVVVGPVDDVAYGRRCAAAAAALPEHVSVEFRGAQSHRAVLDTIGAAHAMVTATAGENFGHTIAEALSVGRPVLLPDTTPWSARVAAGGGEVVPDDAWVATLDRWAGQSAAERVRRSQDAADAYDAWRSSSPAPHVFEMALEQR
jgi:glycosyltransferase involved in cell wall biosynthesis